MSLSFIQEVGTIKFTFTLGDSSETQMSYKPLSLVFGQADFKAMEKN